MYKNYIYEVSLRNIYFNFLRKIILLTSIVLLVTTMQVGAVAHAKRQSMSVTKEPSTPAFLKLTTGRPQVIEVKGRVVDEKGQPFHGALVKLKGEKKSYSTNKNGEFVIQCPDERSIVAISYIGYVSRELSAKAIQANPLIKLNIELNNLNEVGIHGRTIGTKIELKNRAHQNLAQVLEGGVPGLALKSSMQTKTSDVMAYSSVGVASLEETYTQLLRGGPNVKSMFPTFQDFKRAFDNGDSRLRGMTQGGTGETIQFRTNTTTLNTGVVPELRGANNFAGNTNGMLVVIDGFPQDDFPANYPMNNVASIEVIRDPEECLKWGPNGANGVILITTNLAKPGELQVSYNSNFYFSPRPDISAEKLRLASSADLLDYYKEAYDKNIVSYLGRSSEMPVQLSPAEMLLFDLNKKKLAPEIFQSKWDSLARLSNREQLKLLQQNSFNQNHSLNVSGGTKAYRFTIGGIYATDRTNSAGDFNQRLGLNLKNDLSLFNDSFKIRWLADVTDNMSRTGNRTNGDLLDPYQLLLDPEGGYVYNYENITPKKNREMMDNKYFENGVNLLQDLRENKNTSKSLRINSSLDLNWKINQSLNWSTSVRYGRLASSNKEINGAESSQARELINKNGSPLFNDPDLPDKITGVDFYVPEGGIFRKTANKNYNYNIRSGFNFNHTFGSSHQLTATLDGGLSNRENRRVPNQTIYGYNVKTGSGLPLLALPAGSVGNYLGSSINLERLFVRGLNEASNTRNLTLNGNLVYNYRNRYTLDALYSATLVPSFGEEPPYSATVNRSASATWQINREGFFKASWISNLSLTAKASEMQVAKLPVARVDGDRSLQPLWNNAAITVNSYNNTAQSGQKNRSFEGELKAGFSEERLLFNLSFTRNSIGKPQWNARLAYDIARERYFRVPWISSLQVDAALQSINPFQGLGIMMNSNSLSTGGGFNMPGSNDLGLMPSSTQNKEAHLFLGIAKDRFGLDVRYYHKTTSGLSNGDQPTDPATGLGSKVNYSKMLNKGVEASIRGALLQSNAFSWNITLNAAYNINQALDVPVVNFSLTSSYLTANRNGYSSDNLWNFRWAGLDALGNPQVYNKDMQKVTTPDSLSMVYVGRTTAPWQGAVIQDWRYKGFFASTRLMFKLGHVMRKYMPVLSTRPDKSVDIRNRWRKPGDEAFTDVAGIAIDNPVRSLIIQGSDNAVLPADHVRLREVQLGYEIPPQLLKDRFIKSLTISAQVQNVALWTRNKMHLDPETVSNTGVIGITQPRNYILSVNMSF